MLLFICYFCFFIFIFMEDRLNILSPINDHPWTWIGVSPISTYVSGVSRCVLFFFFFFFYYFYIQLSRPGLGYVSFLLTLATKN